MRAWAALLRLHQSCEIASDPLLHVIAFVGGAAQGLPLGQGRRMGLGERSTMRRSARSPHGWCSMSAWCISQVDELLLRRAAAPYIRAKNSMVGTDTRYELGFLPIRTPLAS